MSSQSQRRQSSVSPWLHWLWALGVATQRGGPCGTGCSLHSQKAESCTERRTGLVTSPQGHAHSDPLPPALPHLDKVSRTSQISIIQLEIEPTTPERSYSNHVEEEN